MFRLLRVIIRPSNEPTPDYLIPSALWDPAYNRYCNSIVSTCHPYKLYCAVIVYVYGHLWLQCYKPIKLQVIYCLKDACVLCRRAAFCHRL